MRFEFEQLRRWLWITLWPWVSLVAGPILLISPAQSLIHKMRYSGESITRELSEFLLVMMGLIWAGLVLLEWLLRVYMLRRRKKRLRAAPTQTE